MARHSSGVPLEASELVVDGTTFFKSIYTATSTINPASLADGAGESFDVTVTGAALGDYVLVAPGVDTVDMLVTATVTAADTVTIRLQNETGSGPTDIASSTWSVMVLSQS